MIRRSYIDALLSALLLAAACLRSQGALADDDTLVREDFETLTNWEALYFPKVARHSTYEVVFDGELQGMTLKAITDRSASAIVSRTSFDPNMYSLLRWRWRANTFFDDLDPESKDGDDFPLRIYVMFELEKTKKGAFERLQDTSASLIFGHAPPHATLVYVPRARSFANGCITSPFTERGRIIARPNVVARWNIEEVDLEKDYQACFGEPMPGKARLAIMSDSDNSKRAAEAGVDFIEIKRSKSH